MEAIKTNTNSDVATSALGREKGSSYKFSVTSDEVAATLAERITNKTGMPAWIWLCSR